MSGVDMVALAAEVNRALDRAERKGGKTRRMNKLSAGVAATAIAVEAARNAGSAAYGYVTGGNPAVKSIENVTVAKEPKKKKRPKKMFKSNKDLCKDQGRMKKALQNLKRVEDASTANCTYRQINASTLRAGSNAQASVNIGGIGVFSLETAGAYLRYYDATTGGLIINAINAGTFQKQLLFQSVTSKLCIRNNYQTDAVVTVYLCKSKDDTDLDVLAAWQAGLPDQAYNTVGGALTEDSLLVYPSDSQVFTDLYSSKRVAHKELPPGKSLEVSHTESNFEYTPSTVDSHNLDYQKDYKSFQYLVLVQGTIAHDTTVTAEQGYLPAGVDIVSTRSFKMQYNAGQNIKYIVTNQAGMDTFTNGPVQSHEPIPDNIGYSVA